MDARAGRPMSTWWRGLALALAVAVAQGVARAQPPPPAERAQVYSPYERQTIDDVLARLHARVDPDPEGKVVERIEVVPLDVFEPRDFLPGWLNVFHATTRPRVIRREMLLGVGDRYEQVLVDDTIRNLRRLPQLSIVLVVAVAGSAPDRVGLVVITKDVWSLRMNWDVVVTPGGIESLELQPAETNFLGTHQTVFGHFLLEPSTATFGAGYVAPRLDGSRIALVGRADVVVNRDSGAIEGSYGSLTAGQPLYSGIAEWAWSATTVWDDVIMRRYVDARPSLYADPATGLSVPFQYHASEYQTAYRLTRSFGWNIKHDLMLAAGIDRQVYRVTPPAGADPRTEADFVRASVPASDTRVGPWVQYHTYAKRYLRVVDFDTLALQEDYRLGHDVVVRVYPSLRALGGSRDVTELYAAAQYTFAVRDGLFRVAIASSTQPEPGRIADAFVQPMAHLVTPTIAGVGRIVADGTLVYRWRNYLNATDFLGGGDRLRGYPTNFFVGQNYVAYNVEARSRPVELLSCELAAVAFFDAGDAFHDFASLRPYQSFGVGLRALFPFLDRVVFRADLGVPVERPVDPATNARIAPVSFLVSFGQAFDVPSVSPVPVLPTGESEQPATQLPGQ